MRGETINLGGRRKLHNEELHNIHSSKINWSDGYGI
jgi:hypothetical protein